MKVKNAAAVAIIFATVAAFYSIYLLFFLCLLFLFKKRIYKFIFIKNL